MVLVLRDTKRLADLFKSGERGIHALQELPRAVGDFLVVAVDFQPVHADLEEDEITEEHWLKITSAEELKWWKATDIRWQTTALGVGVVKHTRYRWGDNLKVIDRFKVVKAGTEYKEVDKKIEEVENGAA